MKRVTPASTLSVIAALLVFANAPSAFAKPQKNRLVPVKKTRIRS
jgi:hypothetical protein